MISRVRDLAREYRGARLVCWLHIFLAVSAAIVCALIFGPSVGLPRVSSDGGLLLLAGIAIALVAAPILLLLAPALTTVRTAAPRLWLATLPAGLFLLFHVALVSVFLYRFSQATDL